VSSSFRPDCFRRKSSSWAGPVLIRAPFDQIKTQAISGVLYYTLIACGLRKLDASPFQKILRKNKLLSDFFMFLALRSSARAALTKCYWNRIVHQPTRPPCSSQVNWRSASTHQRISATWWSGRAVDYQKLVFFWVPLTKITSWWPEPLVGEIFMKLIMNDSGQSLSNSGQSNFMFFTSRLNLITCDFKQTNSSPVGSAFFATKKPYGTP
jgi:hypothetical protein